ncbi:TetR/AcrR family transcriptional regulator [Actinomadura napierensis]|uniref:TetR/AcrR family transcriptional regulator n=1 Tax=Actinomadura napierensis TaxID=267854 RepID=A0ABN3A8G9_9ACTN
MPRAGLTPERVIAEAAAVADETGLERLTLAAVAKRCGVSLPGLYKHVEGLAAVKRGIAILAVGEMTARLAAATSGVTGRDALAELSAAYRAYAAARPGRYAASVRAPAPGDGEHAAVAEQAVAVVASAFKGYRLDGGDLVHAIRMWRIACHGFASLESGTAFGLPESLDETFGRLVDALDEAFRTMGR